jgi:hypothetical protein
MSALLVTWTIDDPDHEAALERRLARFDSTRLASNSRVVDTDVPPEHLFRELEDGLGQDDRIYVFNLGKGWIGYGYDAVNDWLHRHVGP